MLFGQDRGALRKFYFDCWTKMQAGNELTELERQVAEIIAAHPEYHEIVANPEKFQEQEYAPEMGQTNPFLHMSLHMAIGEQVKTDRPAGIRQVYQDLMNKHQDMQIVEHLMMDHLVEAIWTAQRNGVTPNEQTYLVALKNLST